jgi:hypothetical protein
VQGAWLHWCRVRGSHGSRFLHQVRSRPPTLYWLRVETHTEGRMAFFENWIKPSRGPCLFVGVAILRADIGQMGK